MQLTWHAIVPLKTKDAFSEYQKESDEIVNVSYFMIIWLYDFMMLDGYTRSVRECHERIDPQHQGLRFVLSAMCTWKLICAHISDFCFITLLIVWPNDTSVWLCFCIVIMQDWFMMYMTCHLWRTVDGGATRRGRRSSMCIYFRGGYPMKVGSVAGRIADFWFTIVACRRIVFKPHSDHLKIK